MGRLTVFAEADARTEILVASESAEVASRLAAQGVRFARVEVPPGLPEAPGELLVALDAHLEAWRAREGLRSADVVRLRPDQPGVAELRARFLEEHTHDEDEVRWFLQGGGVFFLHLGEQVYVVACEAGDLLSVPAGVRHWFDAGPRPCFTALRLFTREDGWRAVPTGSSIARRFAEASAR